MPNPASGVFKQLAYKPESTYGTAPGQASAQSLRRVQSTIDLSKDSYGSDEIRTDLQDQDYRHGVRRVGGKVGGELSAGTWKDFFAAALKRDFAAVAASTGMSITIAGSGPTYTVTRAAGSWLTDGYKTGMSGRLSAGTFNVANASKNLFIVGVTALALTVIPLNGAAMVAEGPIAGSTFTATGKVTYVPTTGHTDKSFAFEHWYSDVAQSELFLGCKVSKLALGLPPTGLATIDMDVVGQDLAETSTKRGGVATTAQYFTSPTAQTSTGAMAAVNGVIRAGGVTYATITGMSFEVNPNFSGEPVVGANTIPFQIAGRVQVMGQITAYFDSVALRDAFVNETEFDVLCAFTADNSAASDFVAFAMHRVKANGATKNDGEGGLVQTIPFKALRNFAGGSGVATEQSTIQVQDSAA